MRIFAAAALALASIALVAVTFTGWPVHGTIDPASIVEAEFKDAGTAYIVKLELPDRVKSDGQQAPYASTLRLLEDGRTLGPPHTLHVDIAALGSGRYSHWKDRLYFSASDDTDPRENGRSYVYSDRLPVPTALLVPGVLFLAAALVLGRRELAIVAARVPGARIGLPVGPASAILLVAASMAWVFQLLIAARQDVSQDDVFLIVGYCLLAVGAQSVTLMLARRHAGILFAGFAVLNTFSLSFVFSGDIARLAVPLQAFVLVGLAALYIVLYRILQSADPWRPTIAAAAVAGVSILGAAALSPFIARFQLPDIDELHLPGLRTVTFQRKPNVYFLGFDAMTPAPLAARLLELDPPPYVAVIERHGGRFVRNLFADQVPTKPFWGALMSIVRAHEPERAVVGLEPAALPVTFLHNGYGTHFTFPNGYMGPEKGPFLSTYGVPEPYSTCSFLGPVPRRFGFLGFCALRDAGWILPAKSENYEAFQMQRLRDVIRAGAAKPQFFASHYPYPNHTDLNYRHDAPSFTQFRTLYAANAALAAGEMDRMLTEIRSSDPDAIVFVFGDHGGWISRGLEYTDHPEFVVQDRHGILGAVFGAEACMPYLAPPGAKFATASGVAAGLLQCLAGGDSPLATNHEFGRIHQAPTLRFEDYAYE